MVSWTNLAIAATVTMARLEDEIVVQAKVGSKFKADWLVVEDGP